MEQEGKMGNQDGKVRIYGSEGEIRELGDQGVEVQEQIYKSKLARMKIWMNEYIGMMCYERYMRTKCNLFLGYNRVTK